MWVIVYRAGLGHDSTVDPGTLQYIDIDAVAYQLVGKLADGMPLAAACEEVAVETGVALGSDLEARVGAWFQQWTALGWISRIDFD